MTVIPYVPPAGIKALGKIVDALPLPIQILILVLMVGVLFRIVEDFIEHELEYRKLKIKWQEQDRERLKKWPKL